MYSPLAKSALNRLTLITSMLKRSREHTILTRRLRRLEAKYILLELIRGNDILQVGHNASITEGIEKISGGTQLGKRMFNRTRNRNTYSSSSVGLFKISFSLFSISVPRVRGKGSHR